MLQPDKSPEPQPQSNMKTKRKILIGSISLITVIVAALFVWAQLPTQFTIAVTGQPGLALINIDTISHPNGELPFRTNATGHYFKVLDPGHYTIAAKLQDGRTGQVVVDMKGQPQKVVLTIQ